MLFQSRNGVTNQAAQTYLARATVWTRTRSSNNLARYSYNNVIPNLKIDSISRQQPLTYRPTVQQWATYFISLNQHGGKTGNTYNFAIIKDSNDVTKPQSNDKANCMYATWTDSG